MNAMLAASVDYWLRARNVEMVWCQWPRSYADILDDKHSVYALGNDGVGVQIVFPTDDIVEAPDEFVVLGQLGYLGRALMSIRYQEMRGEHA